MKQSFQQQAVQEELRLQSIAGKQTFPAGMHILATVPFLVFIEDDVVLQTLLLR